MLLWWSAVDRPDLGGIEDDLQSSEEMSNPEFITPGLYSNVCLNIQVRHLAIDAVLQSAVVNELEGSGGTTAFDSTSHTIDSYSNGGVTAKCYSGRVELVTTDVRNFEADGTSLGLWTRLAMQTVLLR